MQDSLKWCLGVKDGLRVVNPDESLAKSYINEAKSSLKRAETDLNEGDLLWASVVIYYSEYYALYSFLQKIGIKCENHFCSILAVEKLLGKERTETINKHKEKRIDAQYYMRVGKETEIMAMLKEAKAFVAEFDNFISNLTISDVDSYRERFSNITK